MQRSLPTPQAVVIFADESAEWCVAGLRQIDRNRLAAEEYFRDRQIATPPITINSLGEGPILALSTRVVPARHSLPGLLLDAAEIGASESIHAKFREQEWLFLDEKSTVARATDLLLTRTGKSQDGFISRYLNRPLSRALSRLLVRTSLRPNHVTLLLMLLPVAGALLFLRGDYLGFAFGAVLFQLHSMLDGCDGEIARVKYLESDAGRKLDEVCDRLSTMLYAIALGLGLAHPFYLVEGISAALFIGVFETLLTRTKIDDHIPARDARYGEYLRANRETFNHGDQLKLWLIRRTGLLSLGNGAARFFGELTKRDVFNFVFMLLALCGLAAWVLHLIAFSACLIAVLALKELFAPTVDANSAT